MTKRRTINEKINTNEFPFGSDFLFGQNQNEQVGGHGLAGPGLRQYAYSWMQGTARRAIDEPEMRPLPRHPSFVRGLLC